MKKSKTRNWQKQLAVPVALCCLAWPLQAGAEEANPEYSFDEVTVTAMRYATKALDTPADVAVYTNEQLKATGAANIVEALKYKEGIIYHSMGSLGQSWGNMTSQIIIRGVDNGTLVMINGVPANLNGKYNLEQIPVASVERVEIVKGGGSVLYGSAAFGGVINIITKTKVDNTVTVSGGTNQQNHALSFQAGKASFNYNYGKTTEGGTVTDTKSSTTLGTTKTPVYYKIAFGDSNRNSFNWNYKFNDNLNFSYMYGADDYHILYRQNSTTSILQDSHYENDKHMAQLEYKKDDLTSKLYFNKQNLDYTTLETARPSIRAWTKAENTVLGLDTQKAWEAGKGKLLAGFTYQDEGFEQTQQAFTGSASSRKLAAVKATGSISRDHYAVYSQWDMPLSDKTRMILSAREDVVDTDDERFNAFCPQFQTITKIDGHSSWYTNIGKSFTMPNFTSLYYTSGSFVGNPDLKPEKGMNYEIGYKAEQGNSSWKLALFKLDIDDKIEWKTLSDGVTRQAQNLSGFRNSGIEVSYNNKLSDKFSYTVGGSYGNPESQSSGSDTWEKTLGRIQLSGALNYKCGPTAAALSATYFADRSDEGQDIKPFFPVSLHVTHDLSKMYTLTFDVENLLDRKDVSNNSSTSAYYTLPRSYKLGVTARF
ncbi:Colicin I receptor precursor [Sporomusa ovata DSM 2662]|uniref:TonB-dependent receptor Outer membrane receptor for ferrienterochelin and colicins n=1 Tax=Sporomusa ovata TaxID=2378 RepID=A0A0U1L451_9FIRM|nr:TonB-dependent receptor [Sporomusa ovata]EQB25883.1 outer membrane cobalamin receptor protein [Sporomusa ovata DSM 2662]CQR74458.1 TonB-dependent receptor; Outer membrane receptor for ferrienterochelin and colicins [Sporomusa ovata]